MYMNKNKINFTFFTLIILLMNLLTIQAQNIQHKVYTDNVIINSDLYQKGNIYQKDFLLFVNLLKNTHPAFATGAVMPMNIDSINKHGYLWAANCNSTEQLKNYLQSIATLLNDGHTSVSPYFNKNEIYPFAVFIEDKDVYLYAIDKNFDSYLGKKITKINNYPVLDVINSFRNIISSDNETYFFDKVNGYMQFYDNWKYNPYKMDNSSIVLSFIDSEDIILQPISAQSMKISTLQVKKQNNLITEKNKQPFSYVILPEKRLCYFQFNQCTDQSVLRYQNEVSGTQISEEMEQKLSQIPRFDTLVQNMIQEIKKQNIKTLVIDVRNNTGGNSNLCKILLSWLKPYDEIKSITSEVRISTLWEDNYPLLSAEYKRNFAKLEKPFEFGKLYSGFELKTDNESTFAKKMDEYFVINKDKNAIFKGNVVFIQSSKTFSSAGMLIIEATDNQIGKIIGNKSAYKPCSYGDLLGWELPNTKIQGFVSHKIFNRPDINKCNEQSIIPDVLIENSFSDMLDGKDACWDWIIKNYTK